jgi:hypothetical protein
MALQTKRARGEAGMPRGARAVAVLNEGEAVDDADSSSVPACDSILDSSDPLTAGSQAGTKTVGRVGAFHAQHHRQQRPVHPRATIAGSGMNGDGVCGVGEVSVQSRVKVA